jgi:hypothetical protein
MERKVRPPPMPFRLHFWSQRRQAHSITAAATSTNSTKRGDDEHLSDAQIVPNK